MYKATIKNIRKRLYPIITKMFNENFCKRYEIFMLTNQNNPKFDPALIMFEEIDNADALLENLFKNRNSDNSITEITKAYKDETIMSAYMKYYFLTCHLKEFDQTKTFNIPRDDTEFFHFVFSELYPEQYKKHNQNS